MSWTCFKIIQEWGEIGGDIGCKNDHHRNWMMGIVEFMILVNLLMCLKFPIIKKKLGKGEKQDIRISLTKKVTFAVEDSACIGPLLPSGIKILKNII